MRALLVAGIVVVVAIVWRRDEPLPCPRPDSADPSLLPQCYFSASYFRARALFVDQAAAAGAELARIPVPTAGEGLSIDVAVLRGDQPDKMILHISGTHGTEGFIGSAVQSAWLHRVAQLPPPGVEGAVLEGAVPPAEQGARLSGPTVMLVHGLNPFGMAHYRRWNEHGVDLNRNCLRTAEEWEEVLSRPSDIAGYDSTVEPTFNPHGPPTFTALAAMYAQAAILLATRLRELKRALVAATYTRRGGLFYGGTELAPSHRLLSAYLTEQHKDLLNSVTHLTVLDVHTGLGPLSKDTLFVSNSTIDLNQAKELLGAISPAPYKVEDPFAGEGDGGAADGYELTRGTTHNCYHRLFNNTEWVLPVAQEFGTLSPFWVLRAIVEENMAFHHLPKEEMLPYSQGIYDAFAPRRQSFYQEVLERGLALLEGAQRF